MSSVVVIGMFDGLHIGHQALLHRAIAEADKRKLPVTVVTFATHPAYALRPESAPKRIMPDDERIGHLKAFPNVTTVEVLDFTPEIETLSAQQFISDVLVAKYGAQVVVVGENFRFGHQAQGDVSVLQQHIETIVPELTTYDGMIVSSTQVRSAISTGHVRKASQFLGQYHQLSGVVIRGDQRGRTIGFPTANFDIPPTLAIPALGVYAGVMHSPNHYNVIAAISIGYNTTFGGTEELRVEAHFLDFDEELYGQTLTLRFVERLRGQEHYPNVRALIDQLQHDCDRTRDAIEAAEVF